MIRRWRFRARPKRGDDVYQECARTGFMLYHFCALEKGHQGTCHTREGIYFTPGAAGWR